jgi:NAD(P)-dependent dehydrogenase (short-subunit alcohol dehydrogenase family)
MSVLGGKVALVTGAGRGIGRATALELARAGARVAILARSRDDLKETSERVHEIGGIVSVIQADLRELGSLPEVVQRVNSSLGSVAILVNNAATPEPLGAAGQRSKLQGPRWSAARSRLNCHTRGRRKSFTSREEPTCRSRPSHRPPDQGDHVCDAQPRSAS